MTARLQRQRAASCDTFSFMNETEPGALCASSGRVRSRDTLVVAEDCLPGTANPNAPRPDKFHLFLTCLSGEKSDEEAGPPGGSWVLPSPDSWKSSGSPP
jgi:hypothetical protein